MVKLVEENCQVLCKHDNRVKSSVRHVHQEHIDDEIPGLWSLKFYISKIPRTIVKKSIKPQYLLTIWV